MRGGLASIGAVVCCVLRGTVHADARRSGYAWAPLWVIAAGFGAVAGAAGCFVWTARRRAGDPRCHSFGYDLTGNVSGVCPECGTARAMRHGPTAH